MPTWGIHLAVANEVNKKLKLEEDSFLLGNILPDIPNNYIIKDIKNIMSYEVTHYINALADEYVNLPKFPDINLFIDKNKDILDKPVVMGYLVHLLTDLYWNTRFVNDYLTFGVDVAFNTYKQHDFRLFENYLVSRNNIVLPNYRNNISNDCLEIIETNNEDILRAVEYVKNRYTDINFVNNDYLLMPQNELIKIYEDSIKYILDNLQKIGEDINAEIF